MNIVKTDDLFTLANQLKGQSETSQQSYIDTHRKVVTQAFASLNKPGLTPELIVGHLHLKNGCRISPSTGKIIHDILQAARCANAA